MLGKLGGPAVTAIVDVLPTTEGGLDAVRATLKQMAALIRRYRSDQTTRETAIAVLRAAGVSDTRTQRRVAITLLQNWVRDRIAYFHDPDDTEWVQTPPETLRLGVGDCDDKTVLLLALLSSVGLGPVELLAVGGEGKGWDPGCAPQFPGDLPAYSHVLGAVQYGKSTGHGPPFLDGWLTLETIVQGKDPGWKPPGIRVILPWRV